MTMGLVLQIVVAGRVQYAQQYYKSAAKMSVLQSDPSYSRMSARRQTTTALHVFGVSDVSM